MHFCERLISQLRFGFCGVEWVADILHDTDFRFLLVSGICSSFGGVKLRFGFPEWMEEFRNHPSKGGEKIW